MKSIENPASPDEYADGLHLRGGGFSTQEGRPLTGMSDDMPGPKEVYRVHGAWVGWAIGSVLAVIGFLCGSAYGSTTYERVSPSAAETVTVTKTVTAVPESCKRALDGYQRYLNAAAAIASTNDVQLDIFSEANQAILSKDWRKLNALVERQRALEAKVVDQNVALLPNLADISKDIKQCQSESP